jgi:hypothetical protein
VLERRPQRDGVGTAILSAKGSRLREGRSVAIFTPAENDLFRYMYEVDRSFVERLQNKDRPGVKFFQSEKLVAEMERSRELPEGMHEEVRDRYRQWLKQNTTYAD